MNFKSIRNILSVFTAVIISSCSGVGVFLANYPVDESTLQISKNVSYDDKPIQKLDIYKAKSNNAAKSPVIVFFYGGDYSSGEKETYPFLADYFAKLGYVVAIPDYSKYPQVKFPAFVEDGAKAVAWVKNHAAEYGGDSDKMILMGHSAGAHIAALLNYDDKYLAAEGMKKTDIKAFVGLAGPYNFTPEEEKYKKIFGPPENYPNMQVSNFVDGNEAPALLLNGDDDDIVALYNTEKLVAAINAKNGEVESKVFKGIGHISLIAAFSEIKSNEDITSTVSNYLAKILKQ